MIEGYNKIEKPIFNVIGKLFKNQIWIQSYAFNLSRNNSHPAALANERL